MMYEWFDWLEGIAARAARVYAARWKKDCDIWDKLG